MDIGGHWVSMHMVNTMFWLFGLEVLIVVAFLYWLMRPRRPPASGRNAPDSAPRKKRRARRKR